MLREALAITGISIKSIPERWAPSLVIVIGLAGVVAVFTALLAMATGFESTLKATGRSDAVIIMRGGSDAELNSAFDRPSTDLIEQQPVVGHQPGPGLVNPGSGDDHHDHGRHQQQETGCAGEQRRLGACPVHDRVHRRTRFPVGFPIRCSQYGL